MITDYHNFCHRDTPKEKRDRLNIGNIYVNGLECNVCDYFIRSRNKHDMVTCKCGACSIDGGSWYIKVSGKPENYRLITEYFTDRITDD